MNTDVRGKPKAAKVIEEPEANDVATTALDQRPSYDLDWFWVAHKVHSG